LETAKVGAFEAERLITLEKVSGLMGAYQNTVCKTVSEVAEGYEVPFLINTGVLGDLTSPEKDYTFHHSDHSSDFGSSQVDFLAASPTASVCSRSWRRGGGVVTSVCVETAGRHAMDRGYDAVLVDGACAFWDEERHRSTMWAFPRHFGRVATVAEVIAELRAVPRVEGER